MTAPLNMDVHAPRNPAGYWPEGFREKAIAHAAELAVRPAVPPLLTRVVELFPDALEAAVKSLGLAPVPDWVLVAGRAALAACVASVTVTTAGTVTVVDHRTPGA